MRLKYIEIVKNEKISTILLNRPEVRNAFNPEMMAELCAALKELLKDPGLKVMVIRGKNGTFSSRADLKWLKASGLESFDQNLAGSRVISDLMETLHQVPVKAVSGGGGRGMRIIHDLSQFNHQVEIASRESEHFFGDPRVFVEQYIEQAKHIEVQVIGDKHGNLVHLFEREFILNDAVKLAKSTGYDSAGTLEFLLDPHGNHYFMDMNTRIQVELPVTEMVTGIDHAIGSRFVVSAMFDSLIAKVIVCDINRNAALQKMLSALKQLVVQGVETTIDYWRLLSSIVIEYQGNIMRIAPPGIKEKPNGRIVCSIYQNRSAWISMDGHTYHITEPALTRTMGNRSDKGEKGNKQAETSVLAPLPGMLTRLFVKAGDPVLKGDPVATIESMKTENHILGIDNN